MGKWIIFGGTTEGWVLAKQAHDAGRKLIVCVASDYARELLDAGIPCRLGAMDAEEMEAFFREQRPERVIDATHPYAVHVSANIRECAGRLGIPVERVVRGEEHPSWTDAVEWAEDAQHAAQSVARSSRHRHPQTERRKRGT